MVVIIAFRLSSFDADGLAEDPTLRESRFITWTSAELHYSLVAATIPILRPFMSNLSTHYGAGQGPEGSAYGQGTTRSHAHSTIRPRDNRTSLQGFEMQSMTGISEGAKQHPECRTDRPQAAARTRSPFGYSFDKTKDAETGSTVSNESQKMIIRKDITWQVDRDGDN
jgi:hypothetical protein